jgi:hypothetical protein
MGAYESEFIGMAAGLFSFAVVVYVLLVTVTKTGNA